MKVYKKQNHLDIYLFSVVDTLEASSLLPFYLSYISGSFNLVKCSVQQPYYVNNNKCVVFCLPGFLKSFMFSDFLIRFSFHSYT